MRIEFLGHASFLITTHAGARIITDPLDPSGYPGVLEYSVYEGEVDVATISHDHPDHGATHLLNGSPVIIRGNGKFHAAGVDFYGVGTFHDDSRGTKRGGNTVFVISADGITVAHFGDLGHVLNADQAAETGAVDVALIPVGGHFTIDAREAETVADQVGARVVIPMHYVTDRCSFPIDGVDKFIAGKSNVKIADSSVIEVSRDTLPASREIVVLRHSL